ncbi:glycogen debranching protein GlgX [Brenneria izbisi]|uniref:Glycogen debranching enzyme n=1 Tax=Brenneria izbisi TaxID=2939450 RepID=A0AA42C5P4_9GAMM|nr:glycogen debranching protein GlgX [Brenneria izbisi]MCV9879381.1 glycogen debranching protein GlgX [Brenneria izbisi]MCV9882581.1 glycogen debranching protein GlgX [Brenneria izbisi]
MTVLQAGAAHPLGASFDGEGVNFALFSAQAERVELCLFDERQQEQRLELTQRSGDIWHGYLPGAQPGLRYGFRVTGPFAPDQGMRFNPHKLLLDPCARLLDGWVVDDDCLHGGFDQPDERDSADVMAKCVVIAQDYDWQDDRYPQTPWRQTVIYEAHVRGLTQLHPEIPEALRGSYAALGHPVLIDYLTTLGVTALELLPVQQHADEPRLQQMGLRNYWGYNVLLPFAVDNSLAAGEDALNEFRDAVKALHKAGIEVILDVVFNHSAELDVAGPTLSLRGIDNRSYYWLTEQGDYHNWTGCGNVLRLNHPAVMEWVMECLRFWREVCHVDGFRFDLATVLGRTPDFTAAAPLLTAMINDRRLQGCKLIAEPWDIGDGGYQLGRFPAPFAEWSDRYRDDMRRFWLHGDVSLGGFARRFAASSDIFRHHERLPYASINKLTAHDGFTLRDLVCFNHKHNEANGEDNRDGADSNFSHNHGTEGLEADAQTQQRRYVSQRALLTTLLLSQGTPMLLAGDEHGHTQQGNNNAYCQDNELTWLHWDEADSTLCRFTAALIHLRRAIPALTQEQWWQEGDGAVRWLNAQGQPLTPEQWEHGEHRLQIVLSENWLLLINASEQAGTFTLPAGEWRLASPFDEPLPFSEPGETASLLDSGIWQGDARMVCVLIKTSDITDQKENSHGD